MESRPVTAVSYQEDYWRSQKFKDHLIATRRAKAARIAGILRQESVALNCSRTLDVGCSIGLITAHLSQAGIETVGVDIDIEALRLAKATGCTFVAADATSLPFPPEAFDVVVCHQVLEHVPQQGLMISEIYRVLRKGGICYLATVNRFRFVEPHHRLPLLSVLPRPLANLLLRICGRGRNYYERPVDYLRMKRLTKDFRVTDYTIAVVKNPSIYNISDEVGGLTLRLLRSIPSQVLERFLFLSPGWVLVLRKL